MSFDSKYAMYHYRRNEIIKKEIGIAALKNEIETLKRELGLIASQNGDDLNVQKFVVRGSLPESLRTNKVRE